MTPGELLWVGAFAALAGLVAMPAVLRTLARLQAVDHPSLRSSHTLPTTRGAGLAVLLGITVSLGARSLASTPGSLWLVLVALVAFGVLGLVDDLRSLPAHIRFLVQLLLSVVTASVVLHGSSLAAPLVLAALAVTAVWITGFVNVFNFMDGINGISAVTAILGGSYYAVVGSWVGAADVAFVGVALAGAALAFIPFNFPAARAFLGDVGSYSMGAALAICAVLLLVQGAGPVEAVAPLLLYLGDAGLTLLRRIHRGERWWEPHREHAYQRLANGGWGHVRSTALVGVVTAGLAIAGAAATLVRVPLAQVALLAGCVAVVALFVSIPGRMSTAP